MANVLITTGTANEKTAWTKARMDVKSILTGRGYRPVPLPEMSYNPGTWARFAAQIRREAGAGDHLVLEYPIGDRLRCYFTSWIGRALGVKTYAVIHDLNSLRSRDSPVAREMGILGAFDGLVSHNAAMTRWLREAGLKNRIVNLDLFDYCSRSVDAWHEATPHQPWQVLCAGNLSPEKAGYVYNPRLGELEGVQISLYGAFFQPEEMPESPVRYKGVFEPDHPVLDRKYHFGLIWDGDEVDRCGGVFGDYMRYNNPHKLSLYVSMGLPVIVWKEAAIARFVVENRIGVAVADLREMSAMALGTDDYREMAANVQALGTKVRSGDFLAGALKRLGEREHPAAARTHHEDERHTSVL